MLVCKICKTIPTCIAPCDATMYYIIGKEDMDNTCICIGEHKHPIMCGDYREIIV